MAELPDIKLLKEVNKVYSVSPISFHPELPILVNGSYTQKDLSVQFFNVPDLTKVGFINWNTDPTRFIRTVNCVAFHPRLGVMLTGDAGSDNNVNIFNIKDHKMEYKTDADVNSVKLVTQSGHTNAITYVAFHSELPYFATSSWDETAKIWHYNKDDWMATKCVLTLQHTTPVTSIAFHPTQPKLASTSSYSGAKMWDFLVDSAAQEARTDIPSITLGEHTTTTCVAFHPCPIYNILAVSGCQFIDRNQRQDSIKLWDYSSKEKPKCIATLLGHNNVITSIRFHPSIPLLVSGSRDEKVMFWRIHRDVAKISCFKILDYKTADGKSNSVTSIEFGPNHQTKTDSLLATGTFSGMLRLYDIANLRPKLNETNPYYITQNPDVTRLYTELGRDTQTKVLHRFGSRPGGGSGRGGNKTKRNRHKLSRRRSRRTFRKKRKSHNHR